jgi:hypothetical protein
VANLQRAGKYRLNALDTRRHADQVSKYGAPGVVCGRWIMAGIAQKKALAKMQAMGTGGHCCHAAQSADKGRLLVQTSSIPGHVWREVWDTTKAVKDKMSAVKESSPQHSKARIPETALLTFCTGTPTSTRCFIDAAKLCWHRQNMEAGRWPKEALRFSFEGSVVSAGLRWARTGAVMSIHY